MKGERVRVRVRVRVRIRVRDISSFGFGIWFRARQNNGSTSGRLPLA